MTERPARPRAGGKDHEHVSKISTPTTIFLLVVIAILLHELQWVLLPFVIAGLLAFVCTPVIDFLHRRVGVPRALAAIAIFAVLVGIVAVIGWLGIPPLVNETEHLISDFQNIVKSLVEGSVGSGPVVLFGQSMTSEQVAQKVMAAIRDWLAQPGQATVIGGTAFAGAFGVLLTLVLLLYFLLSGPRVMRGLLWLVPPAQRPLILHIWSGLDPVLKRYFLGVIVVVAYAIVAAYVGLGLVLGIQHAVFLALLTGLLEMIPMVGPLAAAVIAGLVAVRYATGIKPIIAYAIYATALRLSIDQILGPLALGTAARVHPVLIIFCFLAGGLLFGITGVIMAVPVALIIKTTLSILYDEPAGSDTLAKGGSRDEH